MFSVGKITKYWLILFKIEVKKIILFVPMTGKKLINIYIDFQTCMNIYIRLIIYSSFYLLKYSTNKHHRKLCIYTHRI